MELREICDDNRVQTLGMLGNHDAIKAVTEIWSERNRPSDGYW